MDRKQVAIIYDVAVCTLYNKFPAVKRLNPQPVTGTNRLLLVG
jgi:hypothetical protein